jgi:hypothetical protein
LFGGPLGGGGGGGGPRVLIDLTFFWDEGLLPGLTGGDSGAGGLESTFCRFGSEGALSSKSWGRGDFLLGLVLENTASPSPSDAENVSCGGEPGGVSGSSLSELKPCFLVGR